MSITHLEQQRNPRATVKLAGEFDVANAALLRKLLTDPPSSADQALQLDLSAVTFFGLAAVNELIAAQRARHPTSPLIAVRPSESVRRVFDLTNIGALIAVDD